MVRSAARASLDLRTRLSPAACGNGALCAGSQTDDGWRGGEEYADLTPF